MDQPSPKLFEDALATLDGYHRALIIKIAEEIVDSKDDFDPSYPGKAEELIDRYGHHLQSLGLIAGSLRATAAALFPAQAPSLPVPPSNRPILPETKLRVGTPVLVEWQGRWWRGEVVTVHAGGTVRIRYVGWGEGWEEVVPRARLQEDLSE